MRTIFWILLFVPFLGFSQTNQQDSVYVDLTSPNATVYTHLYFLQSDSFQPKKAAKTILVCHNYLKTKTEASAALSAQISYRSTSISSSGLKYYLCPTSGM